MAEMSGVDPPFPYKLERVNREFCIRRIVDQRRLRSEKIRFLRIWCPVQFRSLRNQRDALSDYQKVPRCLQEKDETGNRSFDLKYGFSALNACDDGTNNNLRPLLH